MDSPPEGDVSISVVGACSLGCCSGLSDEESWVGRVAAGVDLIVSVSRGWSISEDVWFLGVRLL